MVKRIFRFSKELCDWDGHPAEAKKRLGGKGAGLVLMAQDNMPVPPGFTITTDVCNEFRKLGDAAKTDYLEQLMVEVMEQMNWLKEQFGYMPLVSVRSGAPISMPGMMDTILNVGLTASNHKEWQARIGERATLDSQRRLVQMLGSTAYGVPHQVFEFQLAKVKKDFGAETDADLHEGALDDLIERYCNVFEDHRGFPFPIDNRYEQLLAAIGAVFNSWMNERAVEYRKLNNIDESMGTAVTIQAMVFGNMGDDSGSGVAFTRNPSTGEPVIMGEYLSNAQGEDVVAGIRTPESLSKYITPSKDHYLISCPWAKELAKVCETLEQMYADMVDLEFTVQQGELFILQSRVGKRSARAAFKIAVDLTEDKVIDRKLALARLTGAQFKVLRRPSIDPGFKVKPQLIGLPACPGVVTGTPVFSAEAPRSRQAGRWFW
ncbi:PEP/pyruvate-binding domain-containing protein [Sinorhizobium fredii]|uniref:PEP/pyruvate-binding domain-containing protein n=1 Tax=Rhizobium fredii TaxID=380 RepID=UPI0012973303|nr:hypothetical protein [Sinorhizobium fredii]